MKTMLAIVIAAAAACGVETKADQRAVSECTITLAASSSAADLQQAVDDVVNGVLDPCTAAPVADGRWSSAALARIDRDDMGRFELTFRLNDYHRLNTP